MVMGDQWSGSSGRNQSCRSLDYDPLSQDILTISAEWRRWTATATGNQSGWTLMELDPLDLCDFVLESQTLDPSQEWLDTDCDNDGLTMVRKEIGIDPLNEDTDGDGVIDGDEVNDGTDPLDVCDFEFDSQTVDPSQEWMELDCDGDGVTNGQEVEDETDPTDPVISTVITKILP